MRSSCHLRLPLPAQNDPKPAPGRLGIWVDGMVLPLPSRAMAVRAVFIRSASRARERFAQARAPAAPPMRVRFFETVTGLAASGIAARSVAGRPPALAVPLLLMPPRPRRRVEAKRRRRTR